VISLQPLNLVNINIVHHYLGAKYPIDYAGFYEATYAALDRPQVLMRDLLHPPAMRREDPRAQRAYCIDLLRATGVSFDPLAPLPELRARARESGAVHEEAERVLAEHLPPDRIEGFRRDVRLALLDGRAERNIETEGRQIGWDYGFNGSPFYALLRQADPTLHRPFGPGTARLNLAWQVVGMLVAVWILGVALGTGVTERIAMAALLFASWDFVGWALPGLIFAGVWLPISLALLALSRDRPAWSGFAVAWAGLIKLFPFLLLLPAGVRVLVAARDRSCPPRWALRVLAGCILGTGLLGVAALASGRSWIEFLRKILVQFTSDAYLLNSVSLGQGLLTLGIYDSPLPQVLSIAAGLVLILLLARCGDEEVHESLPRRSLVLLAATGWLVRTWFNYYAVVPLLLLPLLARRHRRGASIAAILLAGSFLLPEFDDPRLLVEPFLHFLKLVPYVGIPAWLVLVEFEPFQARRRVRGMARAVLAAGVLVTAGEALRLHAVRRLDEAGGNALDRGDAAEARTFYGRMLRLDPGNARATMNEAIALASLGRDAEAGRDFRRAAERAPEDATTRQNLGRWLVREGRLDDAARELEAARVLTPWDETILLDLARVRAAQGRSAEARSLLLRARDLAPGSRAVLDRLASPGG